eukprot:352461-Alexandrium_andersonii.AAC.1
MRPTSTQGRWQSVAISEGSLVLGAALVPLNGIGPPCVWGCPGVRAAPTAHLAVVFLGNPAARRAVGT